MGRLNSQIKKMKLRRIKLSGGKDSVVNKNTKSRQMKSRHNTSRAQTSFPVLQASAWLKWLWVPSDVQIHNPFMHIVNETTETESANL